ncbi:MAG: hypothetical protein DI536_14495 [Archangium gephyra]|uniref:Peptidase C-terminal archaeal/bacterial domain-containing protein n=1 Tax=Archangium gephyra TaxID=48 RepID=A0A2W5VA72_9BACT|nr:MAG: hypothetical protein DI536_14495 [Archangium gephyra]
MVYLRSSCGSTGSDVACGQGTAAATSATFTTNLSSGTYDLVVDSYGAGGSFNLTLSQTTPMAPPISDTCTPASPLITGPGTMTGTGTITGLAANYTSGSNIGGCTGSGSGPDGVYLIQHPTTGPLSVSVTRPAGSMYSPIIYLRSTCAQSTTDVACHAPDTTNCSNGTSASLNVSSLQAGTYYLFLDTCGTSNTGAYTVTVTQ